MFLLGVDPGAVSRWVSGGCVNFASIAISVSGNCLMGHHCTWRVFLIWLTLRSFQAKTVETTLAGLQDDPWTSKLPPLMNPAMLEASDDLTSLSHLNEPAGMHSQILDASKYI
jgi:hypothetical protein